MSLKEVYEPFFPIGTSVSRRNMEQPEALEVLSREYASVTCENDMKPEHLLDEAENRRHPEKHQLTPAVRFDRIRKVMDFASENHLGMRGHTLVWHNQTPRWFFRQNYGDEDAPLAGRDTMLARLESYIRSVLGFVQTEYPGVIYAWDVVNEAVEDGGLRRSLWTETVGEDFVLQAFRFASRYAAPGVSLFYNDYCTYVPWKREVICSQILRPLMEEGLVDGVGMQSHLTMEEPDLEEYEKTIQCFGSMGLQVHITELDIHNTDPSEESMKALALRYGKVFDILLKAKREGMANVTGVTFWGMQDEESWLTGFRKARSYPLLFEGGYRPKAAYHTVAGAAKG